MRHLAWIPAALLVAALAYAGADGESKAGLEVGDQAPAFRLNDQEGNVLDLGAHARGAWTLVAFYPKSFTPG